MIYRKAPPQPVRLLLRVVGGVGAVGAVAGALACSSTSPEATGFLEDAGNDARYGCQSPNGCGIMGAVDSGGFMGFVGPDSGEGDVVTEAAPGCDGCGLVVNPDASSDASPDVVTGVVVHPDAGNDG